MAVTVNFGKCESCKENNAMTNSVCRKCNADLPWSRKAKAVKATPAPAARAAVQTRSLPEVNFGLWFMALLSFCAPVIGYFLWRSYSESDDRYASVIGWASMIGLLAHILRVVARVAS